MMRDLVDPNPETEHRVPETELRVSETERQDPVSDRRGPGNDPYGWNELDFIDWREFRQMGPPIVRLEIERIERLLREGVTPDAVADTLRRSRLELVRFVADLERCSPKSPPGDSTIDALGQCLEAAILNAGIHVDLAGPADKRTVHYIISRIQYIRNRLNLIYELG